MEKIIVMLYILPKNNEFSTIKSKLFIGSLWKQLSHPPANFLTQVGYQWRSADGSGNNLAFPDIGKSGQTYVQNCRSKRSPTNDLPDPGLVFDELLRRCPDKDALFKKSESLISSNFFYFATLITHDLFNTDPIDKSINTTTTYLDLSPLYGWTKAMQDSIRTDTNGLLKSDQFVDTRFWIPPVGVTAFLVLFSRNHNYLAENLLKIDETSRFSSLKDQQRDEALFQTARLINQRTYVNIIIHDYLRVIFGINRVEN
ncbi:unnamed protein product [Rotaria magnacalcarata]|uniref:Uncharacterized protein n=2 Tax=Rotaria magnacalcarata TaxID=392030 RepID=A0A815VJV3_9BILA|nr:unnamed protein product [Rotaria magnacalcarata]CAF1531199.1 unnamed protein product [Rotaria magnacalcarata]CAF2106979.1 unnamed protein product [Rotaria magnacalcarata]CAF3847281.1 unnamed protein product [Rotaria magnacalcarata]CAF3965123.1 unnamed protein product [Rotaria magnacalcarata]